MKYPKEYLDEIKTRLKVSSVVSKVVTLKKRGKEYVGLSPFKNEKTPSFTVNEGVFSFLKGESPTNSFPLFFKVTNLETTLETFRRVLISSKYSFGYFIIYLIILLIKLQLLKNQFRPHVVFLVLPLLFPYL